MKNKITNLLIIFLISILFIPHISLAKPNPNKVITDADIGSGSTSEDNWVSQAFKAAYQFLTTDVKEEEDSLKLTSKLLPTFKRIIRAINLVLIVLLFSLSTISLSIIGIRYMMTGAAPAQRQAAIHSLHTLLIGMGIGFGAFVIWNIAMSIIGIIIGALAQ